MSVLPRPRDVVRVRRHQERMDGLFPVARQLIEAPSHAARAALVLRLSDELVLSEFAAFTEACQETGFDDGRHYLLERYAALVAVRDPLGLLRGGERLEYFRSGLAALAQGAGQ